MSWFHDLFINDVKGSLVTGNKAIIDVLELPTENINLNALYRQLTARFMRSYSYTNDYTCVCVYALPTKGKPVIGTEGPMVAYYNLSDKNVYGYIDSMLESTIGVPAGWYSASQLFLMNGENFAGVYTEYQDAELYLLVDYTTYSYEDAWVSMEPVGIVGSGIYSEVFNSRHNIASGDNSHAEGLETTASNEESHAEGFGTTASGSCSHAEGARTNASYDASHAEGSGTTASGTAAHSEGYETVASGSCAHSEGKETAASGFSSHAEGFGTTASGSYQHVQGRYNIVDDADKYAHIVGNGDPDKRSNAHTLDWKGNARYAGSVECTKTILKSPNGTRFEITVGDDGSIKATAI